jgi:hypothetical protein
MTVAIMSMNGESAKVFYRGEIWRKYNEGKETQAKAREVLSAWTES